MASTNYQKLLHKEYSWLPYSISSYIIYQYEMTLDDCSDCRKKTNDHIYKFTLDSRCGKVIRLEKACCNCQKFYILHDS